MADVDILFGIDTTEFDQDLEAINQKFEKLENGLTQIATASGLIFAGAAAAGGAAVKAFADFETGLAGVAKTTNLSGKELEDFGKSIQQISKDIPIGTDELLSLSQTAAQLGVTGTDNIQKFAVTIAQLGRASDISGEQAAQALAQLLNQTGESVDGIDRLASSIVALGNNFATTESKIVRTASEVGRSTAAFGISSAEVVGLSTALASLGVQAQLGGSVVGKAFRTIDQALREGGSSLKALEQITGETGATLQETFAQDKTKVFQLFVEGLGKVGDAGGSVAAELEKLGLKGDEVNKVLPVLAKRADLVGDALSTASSEFEKNTALQEEFQRQTETLSAEFDLFVNRIVAVGQAIGARLAPFLEVALKGFGELFNFISGSPVLLDLITNLGIAGGAVAGLVTVVAGGALAFIKLQKALLIADAALKLVGLSTKALLGATGIGALIVIVGTLAVNWETVWPRLQKVYEAFVDNIGELAGGLGQLLLGIFTFDVDAIKAGFDRAREAVGEGLDAAMEDVASRDAEQRSENNGLNNTENLLAPDPDKVNERFIQTGEVMQAGFEQIKVTQDDIREAQEELEKEQLDSQKKFQKEFLKNQMKFGETYAQIWAITNSQIVKGSQQGFNELEQLTRSENNTLKAIGKAAAVANIVIKTAESAMNIYAGFSTIPIIGPALGVAGAAAAVAFGAEQIGKVVSAQTGGFVPSVPGGSNSGDVQPAMLEPGEFIVPRDTANEVIDAAAQRRAQEFEGPFDEGPNQPSELIISLRDDLMEFIETQLVERDRLKISVQRS